MTWMEKANIKMRENWYRDVWLVIITGLSLLAIWLNSQTLDQQAKGRHFAVGVTCSAISAISQAGQQVLSPPVPKGPKSRFERALERLGYPPPNRRRIQSELLARLYVEHISEAIQRQVGGRGAHLVRPNGTLDCRQLQRLANTGGVR